MKKTWPMMVLALGVWIVPGAQAQQPTTVEYEQRLVQMQQSLDAMQQQMQQMQRSQGAVDASIEQRQAHRRAMMQQYGAMPPQRSWGGCCMGCAYMDGAQGVYPQPAPMEK